LGGDWAWLALAGAAFVLRRALRDGGGPVSSVTVAPGEQVLITVRDPKAPGLVPAGAAANGAAPIDA
jgi:hypothetical protein